MSSLCNSLLYSSLQKEGIGGRSSYLSLEQWTQVKSKYALTKHTSPSRPVAESLAVCFNSITCSTDRYYSKCLQHMEKHQFRWEAESCWAVLSTNTCRLVFGALRRNKILGTLACTFTYLPWVLTQILAVLPLSQHRIRLMQRFWHCLSPAVGGSLIRCHHLSGLCLHLPSVWTLTWQTAQAI